MTDKELLMQFVMHQHQLGLLFTNAPRTVYEPIIERFLQERHIDAENPEPYPDSTPDGTRRQLTELFHRSLTQRGKTQLTNHAIADLEEQDEK